MILRKKRDFMKNKLLLHLLIDISIAFGLLILNEQKNKRKEIKKLNKKLSKTQSSIQALELDLELQQHGIQKIGDMLKVYEQPKE